MLLVFGVLACLAANAPAVPPHAHYTDIVRSADGRPVPGAKVRVCKAGTDVKAMVYRGESAGTTKSAFLLDLTSAAKDASSTGWNLGNHLAFDENTASRWSSEPGLPPVAQPSRKNEWIWIDCGADVRLRTVWVDFQSSASVDYTVRLLTEKEGAALNLAQDRRAGGGVQNWKIIASAKNLPNGVKSPNRKRPGVRDRWDFVNGSAVIPDNRSGLATVEVTNPVGRYLMIDTTKASDPGYGNVSIWEIAVETEWQENGPPMKNVVYTTDTDNFVEQPNPITTDKEGRYVSVWADKSFLGESSRDFIFPMNFSS